MHWKRNLFTVGAAGIGLTVLALYWNVAASSNEAPQEEAAEVSPAPLQSPFVTMYDPSKGPKDAKVTIVEFGDHACPYCHSAQETVDRLMAEHPEDVRFVWKSAPSPLHRGSDTAAKAALCAARQGRFWEYHEKLFENANVFDQTSMAYLASELGLETLPFNDCLANDLTLPQVEQTVQEARALGMTSIPTMYVNGVRYEGALSYEELLEATGL